MKRPEDGLQHAVIEILGIAAVPGLWWFAVPNGGWRSPVEARIMKGLGVRAGVHDLILCIPPEGKMAGLELKAGKRAYASKVQQAAHVGLMQAGGLSGLAHNIEEAYQILINWKAIDRTRIKSGILPEGY